MSATLDPSQRRVALTAGNVALLSTLGILAGGAALNARGGMPRRPQSAGATITRSAAPATTNGAGCATPRGRIGAGGAGASGAAASAPTLDDVTRAYRRMALATHPDRPNGDALAFKAVNDAYTQLQTSVLEEGSRGADGRGVRRPQTPAATSRPPQPVGPTFVSTRRGGLGATAAAAAATASGAGASSANYVNGGRTSARGSGGYESASNYSAATAKGTRQPPSSSPGAFASFRSAPSSSVPASAGPKHAQPQASRDADGPSKPPGAATPPTASMHVAQQLSMSAAAFLFPEDANDDARRPPKPHAAAMRPFPAPIRGGDVYAFEALPGAFEPSTLRAGDVVRRSRCRRATRGVVAALPPATSRSGTTNGTTGTTVTSTMSSAAARAAGAAHAAAATRPGGTVLMTVTCTRHEVGKVIGVASDGMIYWLPLLAFDETDQFPAGEGSLNGTTNGLSDAVNATPRTVARHETSVSSANFASFASGSASHGTGSTAAAALRDATDAVARLRAFEEAVEVLLRQPQHPQALPGCLATPLVSNQWTGLAARSALSTPEEDPEDNVWVLRTRASYLTGSNSWSGPPLAATTPQASAAVAAVAVPLSHPVSAAPTASFSSPTQPRSDMIASGVTRATTVAAVPPEQKGAALAQMAPHASTSGSHCLLPSPSQQGSAAFGVRGNGSSSECGTFTAGFSWAAVGGNAPVPLTAATPVGNMFFTPSPSPWSSGFGSEPAVAASAPSAPLPWAPTFPAMAMAPTQVAQQYCAQQSPLGGTVDDLHLRVVDSNSVGINVGSQHVPTHTSRPVGLPIKASAAYDAWVAAMGGAARTT
jgi:curved DNA-binding protein CbpA